MPLQSIPNTSTTAANIRAFPELRVQVVRMQPLYNALVQKATALQQAAAAQGVAFPPPLVLAWQHVQGAVKDIGDRDPLIVAGLADLLERGKPRLLVPDGFTTTDPVGAVLQYPRLIDQASNILPGLAINLGVYRRAATDLPAYMRSLEQLIDQVTGGSMPSAASIAAQATAVTTNTTAPTSTAARVVPPAALPATSTPVAPGQASGSSLSPGLIAALVGVLAFL